MTAMQHALHPWSTFFIMPLFAFFNAGINFADAPLRMDGLTAGIVGGLFIGKPLGIVAGTYLATKAGWAEELTDLSRLQFTAVSMLAGIGFTMSLFIGNLAFIDQEMIGSATGAVLVGSFLSAVAGALLVFAHEKRLAKQSANEQDKPENS
jgi:Na+:H+ antiporter, NhaA family